MHVAVANAGVDEDAVVVSAGDAAFANRTVLGAGGLEVLAGCAGDCGVKVGVVVGVEGHVMRMGG